MPWKIVKRKGQFCVVKKDDPEGDSLGCHGSKDEAKEQLAALYAKEPQARMGSENSLLPADYAQTVTNAAKGATKNWSYDEKRQSVQMALNSLAPKNADGRPAHECWIREMYDAFVIYSEGYGPTTMYKRSWSIDSEGAVTLGDPQAVVARTSYEPVVKGASAARLNTAPFSQTTGWVVREGPLFEAGFYPDKQFNMLPNELEAAADRFNAVRPEVKVDLEHMPTVLDGKLGHVEDIWVGEDGITLFGRVALPTWLDSALGPEDRKVSATWDRDTKDLVGLALVLSPRVNGAALMSAFSSQAGMPPSAVDRPASEGTRTGGPFMAVKDWLAPFLTTVMAGDMSREQAAAALSNGGSGGAVGSGDGVQAGSEAQAGTAGSGAATAGTSSPPPAAPPPTASVAAPTNPPIGVQAAADFAQHAAAAQLKQEQMQAELDKMKADYIRQGAVSFADRMILIDKRALPSERDAIMAAYQVAAWDDHKHPITVTFGKGIQGTRVDALSYQYASRTQHTLDQEMVVDDTAQGGVLFAKDTPKPKDKEDKEEAQQVDPKKVAALLDMTTLGQATLRSRSGQKSEG